MREFRFLVADKGRTAADTLLLALTEAEAMSKLIVWSKKNYGYYVFESVAEFERWEATKEPSDRMFFEVVDGRSPQRLKLDFDGVLGLAMLEDCMAAIKACWRAQKGDVTAPLYVFRTSAEGYHVVVDYVVRGVEQAKKFAEDVKKQLPESAVECLDMRVYGRRQNFRIVGSRKDADGRPKKMLNGSVPLAQTLIGVYEGADEGREGSSGVGAGGMH
jgi:hypothetical protein